MMQVNLYQKFRLHGVFYHSDVTGNSEVHIDIRDGVECFSPLVAYITMTSQDARRLAAELIVAADRCGGSVKGWDFIEGNKDDAAENV